jgi:hypothetical protein
MLTTLPRRCRRIVDGHFHAQILRAGAGIISAVADSCSSPRSLCASEQIGRRPHATLGYADARAPTFQGTSMTNRVRSSALRREQLLTTILDKAAHGPGTSLMAARALHVAFAFQVAVNSGTLRQYLAATTTAHLRYLAIVYQAIGARGVAHTLFEALAALQGALTETQRQQCFLALEQRLFETIDPLHDRIARLTQSVH